MISSHASSIRQRIFVNLKQGEAVKGWVGDHLEIWVTPRRCWCPTVTFHIPEPSLMTYSTAHPHNQQKVHVHRSMYHRQQTSKYFQKPSMRRYRIYNYFQRTTFSGDVSAQPIEMHRLRNQKCGGSSTCLSLWLPTRNIAYNKTNVHE